MKLNKLAGMIAKKEGKKSQARIGDIREILKIIVELSVDVEPSENAISALMAAAVYKGRAKDRKLDAKLKRVGLK